MTPTESTTRHLPPLDRQRLMAEAIDLHRRGRFVEAERIYRRVLQMEPAHPDALHLLGLIAKEAGQADAAVQLIQKAIAASPASAAFRSNLAMIFEQEGRFADCEAAARGALEIDPEDGNALRCLANVLAADGRHREAIEVSEKAVRIHADDVALWRNLGRCQRALGRNEQAVTAFRRATALAPGNADIHIGLAQSQLAAGRIEEAAGSYREAVRLDPGNVESCLGLAGALLRAGQADESVSTLRRCLEAHPGNAEALACLAVAASEAGDSETLERLLDYDRLIVTRTCQPPRQYESTDAFHRELLDRASADARANGEAIESGATSGGAPTDAPPSTGTGSVAAFEEMAQAAVAEYMATVTGCSDHPFLSAKPEEWRLVLRTPVVEGNDHGKTAKPAPGAWLTGVYYAEVTPIPESDPPHGGWIELRPASQVLPDSRTLPTRMIEPLSGLLLLFPSYLACRTLPSAGRGRRVSLAFDVVRQDGSSRVGPQTQCLSVREAAAEAGRIQDLLKSGDRDQARRRAGLLAAAVPQDPASLRLAGLAAYRSGEPEMAEKCLAGACQLDPESASCRLDLAACQQRLGKRDEAADNLRRAADLDTDSVEALMRLATLASDQGDFEEARNAYQRAIERQPAHGAAHYGLASLKTFGRDDPQIEQLRSLLDDPSLQPSNEAVLCFALARALDQLDRLDEAMTLYERANRIKRELTDFDIAAERNNISRIMRSFGPALFEKFSGAGVSSELPVFVIGMPRSGTTLVEQILDSHPRVHGAGELNDLWRVVGSLGQRFPAAMTGPEGLGEVDPAIWRELGERFLTRLRACSEDADRIVDKLPFNYTLAGIIRIMLPEARIIHCVRDPRDTCVSCYLTSFQNDRGFTCDLAELGETYRLYWDLMEHWRRVLPGGFHEVRYERLVDDLESESRRMVDYLGLEWSDSCLRFFENPRRVTTASMTQVRQPVYSSSVGRWRRYAGYLDPLLENLGDMRRYGVPKD